MQRSSLPMMQNIALGRSCVRHIAQRRHFFQGRPLLAPNNGTRCRAFFNFNKNKEQDTLPCFTREYYTTEEVEDYFNYMGMLAAENIVIKCGYLNDCSQGSYDRMERMLATGQAPVDLLLLMACSENDTPKVEELLRAGANPNVTDLLGLTPLELCTKEEIKGMLEASLAKRG